MVQLPQDMGDHGRVHLFGESDKALGRPLWLHGHPRGQVGAAPTRASSMARIIGCGSSVKISARHSSAMTRVPTPLSAPTSTTTLCAHDPTTVRIVGRSYSQGGCMKRTWNWEKRLYMRMILT